MISGSCTTGQSGWQGRDPSKESQHPGTAGGQSSHDMIRILPVLILQLLFPFCPFRRLSFPRNLAPSHHLTVLCPRPYLFLEALLLPCLSPSLPLPFIFIFISPFPMIPKTLLRFSPYHEPTFFVGGRTAKALDKGRYYREHPQLLQTALRQSSIESGVQSTLEIFYLLL